MPDTFALIEVNGNRYRLLDTGSEYEMDSRKEIYENLVYSESGGTARVAKVNLEYTSIEAILNGEVQIESIEIHNQNDYDYNLDEISLKDQSN